jgi:DNA (cytosine-5)-methyltransferase 1
MHLCEQIPIVSLFCGCGGMDFGMSLAGFSPILAFDVNPVAVETYNRNNPPVAVVADLSELSGRSIAKMIEEKGNGVIPRGIVGGPPCQSFSVSNVHRDPDDTRNGLPLKFASIVHTLNRRYSLDFFVFENVMGLRSEKSKPILSSALRDLEQAGFNVFVDQLDTRYFGVAQSRNRLFVVGVNRTLYPFLRFVFPQGDDKVLRTVRDVIGGFPQPTFYKRSLSPRDIPFHPNHWTMNPKSVKFSRDLSNAGKRTSRSFRRLEWDQPSPTVAYGHREINLHPNGSRRLSVLEAMRIQGFPMSYQVLGNLTQQVAQVSDALPPAVSKAIGESIRRTVYLPARRMALALIDWYGQNGRAFPWREAPSRYSVMIAEKLLQQTSATPMLVATYSSLISKYPTVTALSNANTSELDALISGLGLGYRSSELLILARALVERHGTEVPSSYEELIGLPGVGPYIARCILCFGDGEDLPVVDINVARFIYRVFNWQGSRPKNPARSKELVAQAEKMILPGKARIVNWAILDLCHSVCKPRQPSCSDCPLIRECQHYLINGLRREL